MVVDTESAVRHQTLSHFIHTFIRNYDRESAADRTMRSQYVPRNIKVQLLAAVRECGNDGEGTVKISSIADMGLFIDSSCNEIAYYHSITSSVLQWTMSLYVHDARVKNIIKTVLDDMGRIGDEDIQFILEKYRYNEERRLAGLRTEDTGIDKVLSILKPKKFQPSVSYFSYYSQSVMLKLARSLLQNSALFLNGDLFRIGSEPPPRRSPTGSTLDVENTQLYDDYKRHRKKLATMDERVSLNRMQHALNGATSNGGGVASVKEPPDEIVTVYDQPFSEDELIDGGGGDDESESHPFEVRATESPPHSREDLEVERIMKRSEEPEGHSENIDRVSVGLTLGERSVSRREMRRPMDAVEPFNNTTTVTRYSNGECEGEICGVRDEPTDVDSVMAVVRSNHETDGPSYMNAFLGVVDRNVTELINNTGTEQHLSYRGEQPVRKTLSTYNDRTVSTLSGHDGGNSIVRHQTSSITNAIFSGSEGVHGISTNDIVPRFMLSGKYAKRFTSDRFVAVEGCVVSQQTKGHMKRKLSRRKIGASGSNCRSVSMQIPQSTALSLSPVADIVSDTRRKLPMPPVLF